MDRDQRERTKEEESIDAYIVALHAMTTGILRISRYGGRHYGRHFENEMWLLTQLRRKCRSQKTQDNSRLETY